MFERNCPSCDKKLTYKKKRKCKEANEKNSNCSSCAKKGINNPMFGMCGPLSVHTGKRGFIGDENPSKRTDVRIKISKALKGRIHGLII